MWQYRDMIYSLHNLEPVCFSLSSSNCCFLTCIHVFQLAGKVIWYFHLFKSFPQFAVIHTVKGFGEVKTAETCFSGTLLLFLWSSGCWQFDLWCLCLSKSSLNIWEFSVSILLKPGLENFECCFASVWDECSCAVVWTFFGIAFIWDWNSYLKQDMKYGHSYF